MMPLYSLLVVLIRWVCISLLSRVYAWLRSPKGVGEGLICIGSILLCPFAADAQSLFAPKVSVSVPNRQSDMMEMVTALEEVLTLYISNYTSPVALTLKPKFPIPVRVSVQLLEYRASGVRSSVEVEVLRPIYGSEEYTPLLHTRDSGVEFPTDPGLWRGRVGEWSAQPAQLLRLATYLLEGAMLYYDSFAEHGGDPLLSHLREHRQLYQSAIDQSGEVGHLSTSSPLSRIAEWDTPSGKQLRELWYLYHRHVLDQQSARGESERAFVGLLPLLVSVWNKQEIPEVVSAFSHTKASELIPLLQGVNDPAAKEVRRWLSQYEGIE